MIFVQKVLSRCCSEEFFILTSKVDLANKLATNKDLSGTSVRGLLVNYIDAVSCERELEVFIRLETQK